MGENIDGNLLVVSFYHWQTLIAGVLALLAGLATIAGIRDQIEVERTLVRDERVRRAASHRAVLPMVLSTLCDLSENDLIAIRSAISAGRASGRYKMPEFKIPTSLSADIETIRMTLEYEDPNHPSAQDLRMLLAKLQIYRARRRPPRPDFIFDDHDLQSLAINCIELYAIASSLFRYSRPAEIEDYTVGRDRLIGSAHNMGLWEGDHDGIMDLLDIYYPPDEDTESTVATSD